jgi:hypothetical protein
MAVTRRLMIRKSFAAVAKNNPSLRQHPVSMTPTLITRRRGTLLYFKAKFLMITSRSPRYTSDIYVQSDRRAFRDVTNSDYPVSLRFASRQPVAGASLRLTC